MGEFKLPNINNEKSVLKTMRIKYTLLSKLEKISSVSNVSVNRLINECISFALDNLDEDSIKIKTKEELKDQDKNS